MRDATQLQGDVIAILDGGGNAVVQYSYDAWGKLLSTTGSMATTLGVHNPLRYRGYVYDHESCTTYALGYNVIGGSSIFPSTGEKLFDGSKLCIIVKNR